MTDVLAELRDQLSAFDSVDPDVTLAAAFRTAGLRQVTTANELSRIADALIAQGGVVSLVGRGAKVRAILAGATP